MRYAANVTGHAHIAVMKSVAPGKTEGELQSLFEYECSKQGAMIQAYMPIVASGKRGAILHYGKNNMCVPDNKNQLLLIDAGCEYECYASDVTRTYPAGLLNLS
jgi:Xaa-Pro dipeptidase